MTTGLTYSTYVTQLAELAVVQSTDSNFQTILPSAITYAENRIYRDVDFLFTSKSITGYSVAANTRTITIPQGTIVVSEQINVLDSSGNRTPLLSTTKEFLDAVYGSATTTGKPAYYAAFNDNLFYVGPYADQTYGVEIVGTYRPDSLSATNTSTFISTYLPDLFLAASMVYVGGYQRNFSSTGSDPQMPLNWETQYQTLLKGAVVEEARKKYQGPAWASESPAPVATPSR